MNKSTFDAHPLPRGARQAIAAAAAVAGVAVFSAACWTAGPGNWVPPMVREVADGRRAVTELPPVVVTGRREPGVSRAADGSPVLLCEDGSLPVAHAANGAAGGGNLQP